MKVKDLKHGMKVTCQIDVHTDIITDAKLAFQGNKLYICQNVRDGFRSDDKLGYNCSWFVGKVLPVNENYSIEEFIKICDQQVIQLTVVNEFKVGDLIKDCDGYTAKVLAVYGGLIARSSSSVKGVSNDHDRFYAWLAPGDIKIFGWTVVAPDVPLVIDGKEVKFEKEGIKIGCQFVSKKTVKRINDKLEKGGD